MEDADTHTTSPQGEHPSPPPRVLPPTEGPPEIDEPEDEEVGYGYGV